MTEKWVTCVCSGMFVHVDCGVLRADVQELDTSSAFLTHLSGKDFGVPPLREWGRGWVAGQVFSSRDAALWTPARTPLPIASQGWGAAVSPALCPEGWLSHGVVWALAHPHKINKITFYLCICMY